ncbi:MAG TPA: putative toxin-antitoxin system toxin component, PIN family [Oculatellaceae cyanobacterium]|jgi:putative PIN family toxin of toxin-antitoxin system
MTINDPRFVIDTNVLVSALLFSQSKPRQALDKAQDLGVLLLSSSVFLELEAVLSRPKFNRYIHIARREEFLRSLAQTAQFIEPNELINDCRDEKDNKFLELAVSGNAEYIITRDDDLLVLNPFRGINILTVQQFLENS